MIPSRTVVHRYLFIAAGTRPRIIEAKGAVVHRYHIIAAGTRPRVTSNCGVGYLKQIGCLTHAMVHRYLFIAAGTRPRVVSICGTGYLINTVPEKQIECLDKAGNTNRTSSQYMWGQMRKHWRAA